MTSLMEDKRNRLVDVAQYIGHRSLSTTVNCYWHVDLGNLYNRLQFPSGWCRQKKGTTRAPWATAS